MNAISYIHRIDRSGGWRYRGYRWIEVNSSCLLLYIRRRETGSGDTIIDGKDDEKILLSGVTMPQPVFTSSIEYEHQKDLPALQEVLLN